MPNPDLIPVPFAQDGQKNSIQLDRVVSDPAYRATWAEGFPADTRIPKEVGGEGPDGLDFNGILNALSQAVVFLQKGNAYQFDASLAPYPIGALVRSNDNLTTYQSIIAGNSNDPNSNMTGWRIYNSSNFLVNDLTTGGTDKALTAEMGKALLNMFGSSLVASGYQKIANPLNPSKPLIIQWGQTPLAYGNGVELTFNYPIPFTEKSFVFFQDVGSSRTLKTNWKVSSQGLSSCTYFPVGSTDNTLSYFANVLMIGW